MNFILNHTILNLKSIDKIKEIYSAINSMYSIIIYKNLQETGVNFYAKLCSKRSYEQKT